MDPLTICFGLFLIPYLQCLLADHGSGRDIGGGLVVTIPSLKELKNPDVKDYVEEFYSFGSEEPTENILKVHKLLQHWTAGLHGVGTWHGAGPVMAQKIILQRVVDFEHEKQLVKETLKFKEKKA